MTFEFEKLEVWQLALNYIDLIYSVVEKLLPSKRVFLGLALRSVIETVACQHLINQRKYLQDLTLLRQAYIEANKLTAKLQKMRSVLIPQQSWIREQSEEYMEHDNDNELDEVIIPF